MTHLQNQKKSRPSDLGLSLKITLEKPGPFYFGEEQTNHLENGVLLKPESSAELA